MAALSRNIIIIDKVINAFQGKEAEDIFSNEDYEEEEKEEEEEDYDESSSSSSYDDVYLAPSTSKLEKKEDRNHCG